MTQRRPNKYAVLGGTVEVYIMSKGTMLTMRIDKDDYFNKIYPRRVSVRYKGNGYYACLNYGKATKVDIHRLIMFVEKGLQVDHIDGNTLNNVQSNLRKVTKAQNLQNYANGHSTNKSGVRGVSYRKDIDSWKAKITVNGVTHTKTLKEKQGAIDYITALRKELMPFSTN